MGWQMFIKKAMLLCIYQKSLHVTYSVLIALNTNLVLDTERMFSCHLQKWGLPTQVEGILHVYEIGQVL